MNNFLVFAVLILLYLILMHKAGKSYPILYLFAFTYYLQYIFSTYLIYNVYKDLSFQMPIKKEAYFDYAIPALLFLFAGVFLFHKNTPVTDTIRRIDPKQASRLGYLLLSISLGIDFLTFVGLPLSSIASFTGNLKYLAAFCFLFSGALVDYLLLGIIYLELTYVVFRTGVFVSLFVWGLYLFFFISIKYEIKFWLRLAVFAAFIPVLLAIQSVKDEYRKATWRGKQEAGLPLFSDLVEKKRVKDADNPFAETDGVVRTIGRLTEGWHLGLVLKHVPKREDYAYGKEIQGDIISSILPRLLVEDKKSVNSQEKFYKYTGHKLRGSTSMSIGLIGDFYVNFGRWGSYISLFVFGLLISKMIQLFTTKFVLRDPINIIWIPFILSYLIRANNDFYIFFNCLVKSFFIFILIDYLRFNVLGEKRNQPLWRKDSLGLNLPRSH
ncbi:hypothetical protein WSM22_43520 [Cytophagales bacterium WSM2-2]|nr:hypothetical protein WSM22_43520 [Cytophagales bacterium WSM2-2]